MFLYRLFVICDDGVADVDADSLEEGGQFHAVPEGFGGCLV